MTNERKDLSIPVMDDLDDFEPKPVKMAANTTEVKKAVDKASSFPSREVAAETQLNIKGPADIIERFKALCKDDRRSYYDMLEILMDSFEKNNNS